MQGDISYHNRLIVCCNDIDYITLSSNNRAKDG